MRHATDHDLIQLADGELNPLRAGEIRRHLEACWDCRARQAELQSSISGYIRLYRGPLDEQLPPAAGPRALLRAQLTAQPAPAFRVPVGILAAAACVLAVLYMSRGPGDLSEPKNTLTPGETRAINLGDVCRMETPRAIPSSLQQKVFREYGIADARPNTYEVDYLITPELGGADSIRNLWPQPYSTIWNAHVKDALEDRLHDLVCEGKLDLGTAQREIATDWIGAYKKYFHTDRPLPRPS
jgi:hypothetical protein